MWCFTEITTAQCSPIRFAFTQPNGPEIKSSSRLRVRLLNLGKMKVLYAGGELNNRLSDRGSGGVLGSNVGDWYYQISFHYRVHFVFYADVSSLRVDQWIATVCRNKKLSVQGGMTDQIRFYSDWAAGSKFPFLLSYSITLTVAHRAWMMIAIANKLTQQMIDHVWKWLMITEGEGCVPPS